MRPFIFSKGQTKYDKKCSPNAAEYSVRTAIKQ